MSPELVCQRWNEAFQVELKNNNEDRDDDNSDNDDDVLHDQALSVVVLFFLPKCSGSTLVLKSVESSPDSWPDNKKLGLCPGHKRVE